MEFTPQEIESLYRNIGKNVKKFRKAKKLTQIQLSYEMGYKSVSLVSAAELYANKKHFNIEHLYKVAKVLDVPMSDFFLPYQEPEKKK